MAFTLSDLPYPKDALEPVIDAKTMEIHHSKHHATYVANLNKAIEGTEYASLTLEMLLKNHADIPAIRNHGGGHWNHTLFWSIMAPDAGKLEDNDVSNMISKSFGDFESFKKEFSVAAATRFGSGWAWLCVLDTGMLKICSTPNQDNPLMPNTGCGGTPILGLDVWEHAYYLNYQNRRPDYIQAFFKIINWEKVNKNFIKASA